MKHRLCHLLAACLLTCLATSDTLAYDVPPPHHGFRGAADIADIERLLRRTFDQPLIRHVEFEESDDRGVTVEAEVAELGEATAIVLVRRDDQWRIVERERLESTSRLRRHLDRLRQTFESADGVGPSALAAAIERAHPGGLVLEIDLELEDGVPTYEVEILLEGVVIELHSGVGERAIARWDQRARDATQHAKHAQHADKDIRATQNHTQNVEISSVTRATEYGIPIAFSALSDGKRVIAHSVNVVRPGQRPVVQEVWIEPTTGEVLAVRPSAIETPDRLPHPELLADLKRSLDNTWRDLGADAGFRFSQSSLAHDDDTGWRLVAAPVGARPGLTLTAARTEHGLAITINQPDKPDANTAPPQPAD